MSRDNIIGNEKQENWWFLKLFNSFGKSVHNKPPSIISRTKNRKKRIEAAASIRGITVYNYASLERKIFIILDFRNDLFPAYLL